MQILRSLPKGIRTQSVPLTTVKDTHSSLAFRRAADRGDARRMIRSVETRDALMTYDQRTVDSTGAFLVGELERLDPRINMPLASYTWTRDINMRSDVTMADEQSSYSVTTFAGSSGVAGSSKNWISSRTTAIPNVSIDTAKIVKPLTLWSTTLDWTIPELESAIKLGRPVDSQKHSAMLLKYNKDSDEQTFMGDKTLGVGGMLNHDLLTNTGPAPTGSWATASPTEILADFNSVISSVLQASKGAMVPNSVLLDFNSLNILTSTLISSAGNISILEFVLRNNLARQINGTELTVNGTMWLTGTNNTFGNEQGQGPSTGNSMFAYVNEEQYIRLPMVPMQRTPPQYDGIYQKVTHYCRIGAVEMVYPELCCLRSGL